MIKCNKIQHDLEEIKEIMTTNLSDMLERGEKLEKLIGRK